MELWPNTSTLGEAPDIAVDCLLGTGSSGDPRGDLAAAIRWMNQLRCRRIAIDLPSGLDCDSGQAGEPTVRADRTLTMVGPKLGFRQPAAWPWIGQWQVIDLEVPAELISQVLQENHPAQDGRSSDLGAG